MGPLRNSGSNPVTYILGGVDIGPPKVWPPPDGTHGYAPCLIRGGCPYCAPLRETGCSSKSKEDTDLCVILDIL